MEFTGLDAKAIDAAAKAIEDAVALPGFVTLSSGVTLKVKKVPPLLMRRAMIQIKDPPVPIVHDPDQGRSYENPNDPDYIQALSVAQEERNYAVIACMILAGTSIESVPDDFPSLESDDWVDMLMAADIEIDLRTKATRYLAWMRYVAMTEIDDMAKIGAAVSRLSGIVESDVQDTVSSFRSDETRNSGGATDLSESSANGSTVSAGAGGFSR